MEKSNLKLVNSSNKYWIDPTIHLQETIKAQTIINIMKQDRQHHHAWDCKISFKDFIEGFEKWDERTSTSPSGCHLGVYKALILAMRNNGEFGETKTNTMSTKEKTEQLLQVI